MLIYCSYFNCTISFIKRYLFILLLETPIFNKSPKAHGRKSNGYFIKLKRAIIVNIFVSEITLPLLIYTVSKENNNKYPIQLKMSVHIPSENLADRRYFNSFFLIVIIFFLNTSSQPNSLIYFIPSIISVDRLIRLSLYSCFFAKHNYIILAIIKFKINAPINK